MAICFCARSWDQVQRNLVVALLFFAQMTSTTQLAKRAFVRVLLALASAYLLSITVNRDSSDASVRAAYRRVLLKVHPDKGGSNDDMRRLNHARDEWENARSQKGQGGRKPSTPEVPRTEPADPEIVLHKATGKGYRINAMAVMLTYNGIKDLQQWDRFVSFAKSSLKRWGVKHWCCTLEESTNATLHVHLYIQFHREVDKTTKAFLFEGLAPRADTHDLMGQSIGGRNVQQSINRAFFYVYADKEGTQRDATGKSSIIVAAWIWLELVKGFTKEYIPLVQVPLTFEGRAGLLACRWT